MSGVVRTVAAAVTVMWALSACASAGSTDPGCGECAAELAAVREQIEALPDVTRLRTLVHYPSSPTNGAGVKVELRSASAGDSGLADEVAKIVWQSEITPVDEVFISVKDTSGELVPVLPYDFVEGGRQYASYVADWGPRPNS